MIRTNQCPKCGDNRIAGPHTLHADESHLRIDLPGFYTATLVAFTCANCGYTEFYSDRTGLQNIRRDGRFLKTRRSYEEILECRRCGAALQPGSSMCYECGTPVS